MHFTLLVVACWCAGSPARALDKQGSAHAGHPAGADHGFEWTGSLLLGAALYNPAYAARPDNSGHALGRFAPHFDLDLVGTRLSIPIDVNVFSDRDRRALGKVAPSEVDLISGITSTWPVGSTAAEFGARVEGDFPADRRGLSQQYVDVRARWLFGLDTLWPRAGAALGAFDVAGSATLGWFAYNPSYAARPDNTGRALMRYAAHLTVEYDHRVFVAIDTSFFTDRRNRALAPSELDVTPELGVNVLNELALHLAYERDMPIDRGGLVQHFLSFYLTWGFSLVTHAPGHAA